MATAADRGEYTIERSSDVRAVQGEGGISSRCTEDCQWKGIRMPAIEQVIVRGNFDRIDTIEQPLPSGRLES